jgi:hypothetical protein
MHSKKEKISPLKGNQENPLDVGYRHLIAPPPAYSLHANRNSMVYSSCRNDMRNQARAWDLGLLAPSPAVNVSLTNICYHSSREGGGGGSKSGVDLTQIVNKILPETSPKNTGHRQFIKSPRLLLVKHRALPPAYSLHTNRNSIVYSTCGNNMQNRARPWDLGFSAPSPAVNVSLTNICYASNENGGGGGVGSREDKANLMRIEAKANKIKNLSNTGYRRFIKSPNPTKAVYT